MKFLLLIVKTIHTTVIALKGFPENQYLKADTQQTDSVFVFLVLRELRADSTFSNTSQFVQTHGIP